MWHCKLKFNFAYICLEFQRATILLLTQIRELLKTGENKRIVTENVIEEPFHSMKDFLVFDAGLTKEKLQSLVSLQI